MHGLPSNETHSPALVRRPDELLGGDLIGKELRRDEGQSDAGQQSRHFNLARLPFVFHPSHHGLENDLLGGHVKLVLAHYLAHLNKVKKNIYLFFLFLNEFAASYPDGSKNTKE